MLSNAFISASSSSCLFCRHSEKGEKRRWVSYARKMRINQCASEGEMREEPRVRGTRRIKKKETNGGCFFAFRKLYKYISTKYARLNRTILPPTIQTLPSLTPLHLPPPPLHPLPPKMAVVSSPFFFLFSL